MNREVRESFPLYQMLIKERKTLINSQIILEEKSNNVNWLQKIVLAVIAALNNNAEFIIETRKENFKYYGIKLRYRELCQEPYFRFDSDGPAHRNRCKDIALGMQLITTPHFNAFDKHGCAIAYKSDKLKNLDECKAIIEDINFGVAHFCHESNTRFDADGFPSVHYPIPMLDLDIDSIDPHDSVTFDTN